MTPALLLLYALSLGGCLIILRLAWGLAELLHLIMLGWLTKR